VSFPDSERATEPVNTTSKLVSNRLQLFAETPVNSPDNPKMHRKNDCHEEKKGIFSPFALTQYTCTNDKEYAMQEEISYGSGMIHLLRV